MLKDGNGWGGITFWGEFASHLAPPNTAAGQCPTHDEVLDTNACFHSVGFYQWNYQQIRRTWHAVTNQSCTAVPLKPPGSHETITHVMSQRACVYGVAVWIRLVRVYCRNSTEMANGNPPFSQFVRNSAGTSYLPLNMILWRKRDRGQMQLCCYATAYRDIGGGEGDSLLAAGPVELFTRDSNEPENKVNFASSTN